MALFRLLLLVLIASLGPVEIASAQQPWLPVWRQDPATGFGYLQQPAFIPSGKTLTVQAGGSIACSSCTITGAASFDSGSTATAPALSVTTETPMSNSLQIPWMNIAGNLSGTLSTFAGVEIKANSDTAAVTPGGFGGLVTINEIVNTGATGGRQTLASFLNFEGSSNTSNTPYVALAGIATAGAPDGGTGTGQFTSRGAFYGAGFVGVAGNGATNLNNVTAAEFNTAMQTGSSVFAKSGIQISGRTDDAVAGSGVNSMIWLYNQSGAVPWTYGIHLDGVINPWPIATTGTIMFANSNTATITGGVDFTNVVFSGNAFASPSFSVNGSGVVTGASYKSGATAGVTCSGTPTSSFASSGGIVTHC